MNATNTVAAVPKTKPSHVFPGEVVGAILCRPSSRPPKYAKVSPAHTASSTVYSASRPFSGISRIRIRNDKPPPIHSAPITVALIAAVAAARALENAFNKNARTNVDRIPPSIQSMPESSAPTSASGATMYPAGPSGLPRRARAPHGWRPRERAARAGAPSARTRAATARRRARRARTSTTPRARQRPARSAAARPRSRSGSRSWSSPAESSTPRGVLRQRSTQVALVEVRPELVHEDKFRIRELPEQEVRDAQLAARADQQIGIGQLRRIEVRGEHVLVDLFRLDAALRDAPRRLHELGTAAVVECHPQVEPRVQLGAVLHAVHAPPQVRGRAIAPADEPHAHSL